MASLKLLVIDDEPGCLLQMTELLGQLSAQVYEAAESQQAVSLIEAENFDGIFLDLTMPGLSGYELAKRVRESTRNRVTPIVIVTGLNEPDSMSKSFSIGATY